MNPDQELHDQHDVCSMHDHSSQTFYVVSLFVFGKTEIISRINSSAVMFLFVLEIWYR